MICCDAHERRYRRGQPPERKVISSDRSPGEEDCEYKQQEPNIPEADMGLLVVGNAQRAGVSPLNVLFGGKH
jgi:hypothetical protein